MTKRLGTLLVLALLSGGGNASGQERDWGASRFEATRQTLETALARFESAAQSSAYSPTLRAAARSEAAGIRRRLDRGDFQVGDQVLLSIETDTVLSDTVVVTMNRALLLRDIGEIPLDGVLRSELETYMSQEIGRFFNDPVVRTRPMIRVSILGEVARPGFYRMPAETPITDALMLVGGPSAVANLKNVKLKRGQETILVGPQLQMAIQAGVTLDEIRMQPGDEIDVPRLPRFSFREVLTVTGAVVGTVYAFQRVFRGRR